MKELIYRELTSDQLARIEALIDEYMARIVPSMQGYDKDQIRSDTGPLLCPDIAETPIATNLKEALEIAVASREKDYKLVASNINDRRTETRCKSHQWRIPISAYPILTERLLKHADRIQATSNFDELYDIVYGEAYNDGGIHGVGALMAYDVAFRIGLWMGEAHHPQHVYLHADPLVSARWIFHPRIKGKIAKSEFPEPFRKLSCSYIENFLCVYCKKIQEELPRG